MSVVPKQLWKESLKSINNSTNINKRIVYFVLLCICSVLSVVSVKNENYNNNKKQTKTNKKTNEQPPLISTCTCDHYTTPLGNFISNCNRYKQQLKINLHKLRFEIERQWAKEKVQKTFNCLQTFLHKILNYKIKCKTN